MGVKRAYINLKRIFGEQAPLAVDKVGCIYKNGKECTIHGIKTRRGFYLVEDFERDIFGKLMGRNHANSRYLEGEMYGKIILVEPEFERIMHALGVYLKGEGMEERLRRHSRRTFESLREIRDYFEGLPLQIGLSGRQLDTYADRLGQVHDEMINPLDDERNKSYHCDVIVTPLGTTIIKPENIKKHGHIVGIGKS